MRKFVSMLAVAALIGGYAYHTFERTTPAASTQNAAGGEIIGQKRPDFSLPDLEGKLHSAGQWNGKVVLVNFWATWCPPCRKEMPGFIRLREKYAAQGFDIIGIGIDQPEAMASFAKELGVNYTLLHGQAEASELSTLFGNSKGYLPWSVLLDRDGIARLTRGGELTEAELETALLKYL